MATKNQYAHFLKQKRQEARAAAQAVAGHVTEDYIQQRQQDAVQRMAWLATIALNRTPGLNLGPKRLERVIAAFEAVSLEYGEFNRDHGQAAADERVKAEVDRIMEGRRRR